MIILYSSHVPLNFGSTVHRDGGGGEGVRIGGSDVYFSKIELKNHRKNNEITYFTFHCDLTVVSLLKIDGKNLGSGQWEREPIIYQKIEKFREKNARNNEMIISIKFHCNPIDGSLLKVGINKFGGSVHEGGGSEFI